ncbi:MAG: tRNA (N(6)-L-threonylcarbamoyladenosine(37)-C(2))-methylthiotransferase MtaB [Campylobacterota bacterium]|nr:tRNA (N(6)-L-threonylcarbamoyladenosine(37)-C(2))-methylthiotransferase MtaB [Campylobacterota bacterium]
MKPKVYFKTFGCRTNVFDSQVMMSGLKDYDITQDESSADIIILNSCTVTNGADSSVRSYISQIEKKSQARIYLTGCGAHTKGESLFESDRVFGVFGQSEKSKINSLLQNEKRFYNLGDLNFIDEAIVSEFVGKSRAFIKIQEGCSFRCSYCIIPFVRGDSRSLDESKILEQVRILAGNGFGEFILTGTNIGSYGQSNQSSIASLMKKMSYIRGVRRIRLGSLEPIQIDDEFMEIINERWLERHLHIALQHTSRDMLKLMNRRNKFENDVRLFNILSQQGFALGTDFIVGHPGETQERWREAMDNISHIPLTHLHAFTYSKRDGTPSSTMKPEVSGTLSKERMSELQSLVNKNNLNFRKAQTEALDVLVEGEKEGLYHGFDQFYNKILIASDDDIRGEWKHIENYDILEGHNYAQL